MPVEPSGGRLQNCGTANCTAARRAALIIYAAILSRWAALSMEAPIEIQDGSLLFSSLNPNFLYGSIGKVACLAALSI